MLFRGILVALRFRHLEAGDDATAGVARLDDVVDKAAVGGHVRVRGLLLALRNLGKTRGERLLGGRPLGRLLTDPTRRLVCHPTRPQAPDQRKHPPITPNRRVWRKSGQMSEALR